MEFEYMSHALKRYGESIREEAREEAKKEFLEKGRLIGIDEGKILGGIEAVKRNSISIAQSLLEKNISVKDISEATGLSIEEIEELKKNRLQ